MEKSFTVNILNEATSLDQILRNYSSNKQVCYFGDKRLMLLDGHLGEAGRFHGPVWGLLDEDVGTLKVTRDLTDILLIKTE